MPKSDDPNDPRGLIQEAYRIEGIDLGQCRTVFLDWAMGAKGDMVTAVKALLDRYAGEPADHPMTQTLQAALAAPPTARRRGGRAGRVAD